MYVNEAQGKKGDGIGEITVEKEINSWLLCPLRKKSSLNVNTESMKPQLQCVEGVRNKGSKMWKMGEKSQQQFILFLMAKVL